MYNSTCRLAGWGGGAQRRLPPTKAFVMKDFFHRYRRVSTRVQGVFFAKYDYRFLLGVIIAIIENFCNSENRYFAIIPKYFA
jgi:hypothetical protein